MAESGYDGGLSRETSRMLSRKTHEGWGSEACLAFLYPSFAHNPNAMYVLGRMNADRRDKRPRVSRVDVTFHPERASSGISTPILPARPVPISCTSRISRRSLIFSGSTRGGPRTRGGRSRRIDADTARELRRVLDLGLHRSLGFASFDGYVRERLGMSPSRAWALVRIEKRTREISALGRAWRSGTLSWVRVQTILPVVSGADGARWIDRASEVTVRQLADEVDRALDAADLQMCARPGEEVADREVTFFAPASVVGLFRDAVAAFTPRGEPAGPAGPAELAKPAWKGLERLLEHACQEWMSQPRHRDPVFERDGWRCAVPACSSRRNLHDHHRQFRSRGGTNERSNRVTTCAWHHLRGIHGGLVRVDGLAPDGLLWELGLRPGRDPLLVFEGDRYVRGL